MNMRPEYRLRLLGFSVVLAGAMMADAAGAADAYNGGQIARRWCEPCHVVAADQQGTTGEAPPFASIAKRPGFDAGQLAVFLLDPHPEDAEHVAHPHRSRRPRRLYRDLGEVSLSRRPVRL